MRQSLHDSEVEPSGETATTTQGRDKLGRAAVGNQIARKHPRPRPPDNEIVQRQLAERRDSIIADRGGLGRLSTMELGDIGRYVVLESFVTSWEDYFAASGPISRQGRVRSGYRDGYLASLASLMKLGQQIGVSRVAHDIGDLSIADFARHQRETEDQ